jgi:nucleoside-diphosphate-sugar epimerase
MHTILGANGAIGVELAAALAESALPCRLVSRRAVASAGGQAFAADLADRQQTVEAVAGSQVAYLLVGLKYELAIWRELWPRIMSNVIAACQRAGAKLVFFDNVYAYGRVAGPMTESTPFNPCSRKGEIRARIATMVLDEIARGSLTALIARSADFYGPKVRTSVANLLVLDKFARGAKAAWLVNDAVPHSWTFTPDAGRSLLALARSDAAWNQTWHVPTAPDPPTGRQFIATAARAFGVAPRYRVLGRPVLALAGWFDSDIRESREMLYQYDSDYVFDSTKFSTTFHLPATTYEAGIARCAAESA